VPVVDPHRHQIVVNNFHLPKSDGGANSMPMMDANERNQMDEKQDLFVVRRPSSGKFHCFNLKLVAEDNSTCRPSRASALSDEHKAEI